MGVVKRIQIEGAKPSDMPGFITPQLATLKSKAPIGDRWVHEIKFDGYRLQAHLDGKAVKLFTRSGLDWTNRFPRIAKSFKVLAKQAVLDGEVVVIDDGRTNFSLLQADLSDGRYDRMSFYAFDLLYVDGQDLRATPLRERKRALEMILSKTQPPILYSEHFRTDGALMVAEACKLNWEGIISKDAEAPYRSTRNEHWLKIKCSQKAKFPIIGFNPDPAGVAALHLGKFEGRKLHYVGKVGTGWSRSVSADIRRKLNEVATDKAPQIGVKIRKATWVKPKYFAEVEYRDITADGLLRHSSFKGLSTKR